MSKGYMYDESKKMVWDDSKRDYLTSYETYLLLNEKDAEIKRWKEHKEWDCKTMQAQGDTIEELELSLKRACEAVFDEEIPYDEIQEMKRKHNRYTVGIVLEDILFYYKKLAEEELENG